MLSFSRVSNLPEWLPDWVRAEASVKRRAAALLEAEDVAVIVAGFVALLVVIMLAVGLVTHPIRMSS